MSTIITLNENLPVQTRENLHRKSESGRWGQSLFRCVAVWVCLSSNRFSLQRKRNDRQIYGPQSVFAVQLTMFRQLCMCRYECTSNIEMETRVHGLCIGKCWNVCVFQLALSVCIRSRVKPWFWSCLSAQNVTCLLKLSSKTAWLNWKTLLNYTTFIFFCFCAQLLILLWEIWFDWLLTFDQSYWDKSDFSFSCRQIRYL